MKCFLTVLMLLTNAILFANIRLPRLISDGMVIQRNARIKIWGWADPKESITISFNKKQFQTVASADGNWQIVIDPLNAGGPYTLSIKGNNLVTVKDILVGDIWLCSGQSNMELEMERVKYRYKDEIERADYNFIRQFTVPDRYNFNQALNDFADGQWISATSAQISKFSAVAYFFAKEIYSKYKIPIGLINAALGGSPAEAWISEEAIKRFPDAHAEAVRFKSQQLIADIENHDKQVSSNWYNQLNRSDSGLSQNWKNLHSDYSNWLNFTVPGYLPLQNSTPVNGVWWCKKEIEVPASMAGEPTKLELGRLVDADSVFVNGKLIGSTGYQYPPRRYIIEPGVFKTGRNTITIRLISNTGKGGFVPDKAYELTTQKDTISLKGEWKIRLGAQIDPLPGPTFIRWKPVGLYNAMIAPLISFPIKGVIWYQGESNAARPNGYKDVMETLITDWRSKWQQSQLPFIFVQLANFMEPVSEPQESNWAILRNEQLKTLQVSNTGMAVAIDLGEWNDIHPENKKDVGYRLSLEARRIAYREKSLLSRGPEYETASIQKGKILVTFRNVGAGLRLSKGKTLEGFEIAGADKVFRSAKALIEKNKVIVFSDQVADPKFVRYAWANNPINANLSNVVGLPASPFTTIQ